jgi:hypothetical protein
MQTMKRLLFYNVQKGDTNGHKVNQMIGKSIDTAFDKLGPDDKVIIEEQAQRCMDFYHRLGHNGALELLAAIGDVLNGLETVK